MSVKISGTDAIIRQLEKRYGKAKINKVANQALKKGAEIVQEEMIEAFEPWADTGASRDEIVISNPRVYQGVKGIRLGWSGPKKRWRLIHLNEFGYTKTGRHITPRGVGTIRRTIKSSEQKYQLAVSEELRRYL